MSTVLTREEIFGADDILVEFVKVPEWAGGDPDKGVFVKGLTGTERDSFESAMLEIKGRKQEVNLRNLRAKLIVRTVVDSDDPKTAKHLFSAVDVELLGKKSAAALQRVYSVAQRLSGLSAEDVEDMTKELGEDQSESSGTGSLSPSDTPLHELPAEASAAESSRSGKRTTDESR